MEYTIRPMVEDWRQILEELRQLNIAPTQATLKQMALALGVWHVLGELIRGATYVAIVWIVCQSLPGLLSSLS